MKQEFETMELQVVLFHADVITVSDPYGEPGIEMPEMPIGGDPYAG